MKISPRLRHHALFLSAGVTLALTQCEKKEAPGTGIDSGAGAPSSVAPAAPSPAAVIPPPKAPSLADHASKLGFVGKLPVGTEFYFGTTQLKQHLDELKKSTYWKDMNALVQDKTPAPTAGDKSLNTLQEMWGDDVFIAGGAGFAQTAALLRDFNRLYNEVYFKALLAGGTASLKGEEVGSNPMIYLQSFLSDPASIERLADFIGKFELMPLVVGVKTAKPEEALAFLNDTKQLEEKKIFQMSDLKTPGGHAFRVATVDLALLLPEENQAQMLAMVPEGLPEQTVKTIEKAYDAVQAKKFKLAWGVVDSHLVLACGMNLDHLNLVADPAASVLSKPEMARLLPHTGKNLVGLTYASSATIGALNDDQPFVPMLRGLVEAMKENEMFKEMGNVLDKQLGELSPLEKAVYGAESSTLTAAAWWDKGVHFESYGGIKPRFLDQGKALDYAKLIDKAGVVFGIAYHRNEGYGKDFRAWMEKLVGMLYTGAQELVKAGIAGPDGGQQFAQFESTFLPVLLKAYEADKTMDDKGMGSELAFILDVNGKMPNSPLLPVPAEAKDMKFPRITTVGAVKSREELTKGWGTIKDSINGIFAPEPGVPSLLSLGDPISAEKNGVTTYFFGMPFFAGDFLPVASVNDRVLLLSSSKEAAEAFAGELAQPASKTVDGCVWRLDLGALAEYASEASVLSPTQTPEKTREMKENLKWVKPFGPMTGRIYEENGVTRNTLNWTISDVVSFD